MGRKRLDPDDQTETIRVRVPIAVKQWLEVAGGGGPGAISNTVRGLVNRELGGPSDESPRRRAGSISVPRAEFVAMKAELTQFRHEQLARVSAVERSWTGEATCLTCSLAQAVTVRMMRETAETTRCLNCGGMSFGMGEFAAQFTQLRDELGDVQ